jgi:curved DNA-binding protein CbpA
MKNYYEIFDLPFNTTQEKIKQQYYFLVYAWHPDKFSSPAQKAKAEEKIKVINEAYEVLSNPLKRAQYDSEWTAQSQFTHRENPQQRVYAKNQVPPKEQVQPAARHPIAGYQPKEQTDETRHNTTLMNKSNIIFIVVILILIAAGYFLVQSIQQSAQNAVGGAVDSALAPFQQSNASLQTQVANLLHPTPTIIPDPVTIISDIHALARLETIQYTVEKVVTCEVGQGNLGFLLGDKLLFVGHGFVIAGLDMDKLKPEDMKMVNGVLNVHLPPAEIFVGTLDNNKSYVYTRDTGLIQAPSKDLETLCRKSAEEEIRKAALEDGILNLAQQNAESYLSKFFGALGYPNAVFIK